MVISLPNFPPFDVHLDGDSGPRWKKWLGQFERLIIGMGISDDEQKRALLLYYGGPQVDEIFDTLEDVGDEKDYKKAVEQLNAHFSPQVNITYEVYNFRQAKQKEGETLDNFHPRPTSLAKACDFANPDKEIKEQIILKCQSNSLRRKVLREDLDLVSFMKAGRALELSEIQAKEFKNQDKTVNTVKLRKKVSQYNLKENAVKSMAKNYATMTSHESQRKNVGTAVENIPTKTPALLRTRSAPHAAS